jgi:hypothetical protein
MNVSNIPSVKKLDEVWTADSRKLGLAQTLYERREESDPDLQLYGAYLHVENYEFGYNYYVPVEFIAGYDPENNQVNLMVTFDEVIQQTWFRLPDFVARARGRKIELASSDRIPAV